MRPESILHFPATGDDTASSLTFLAGFENFRKADGLMQKRGDVSPSNNLYRHASRQGAQPSAEYVLQHNIYSLEVCLLETGLWQSFIEYPAEGQPHPASFFGFPPWTNYFEALGRQQAEGKDMFMALTRNEIPHRMGSKYAEIVDTCLTCLDAGNGDFGDEKHFEDEDGISVDVRYIEKVSDGTFQVRLSAH